MNVTIHQPIYLPYLGFFGKVAHADILIIYDTAQYEKGSVHNRQRIRTPQGSTWMTIPLKSSLTPFNETPISYDNSAHPWYEKHWRMLEISYSKTPFFNKYKNELHFLYHRHHPHTLSEFNMACITFLLSSFRIKRKIVFFSDLGIEPDLSPSHKLAAAVSAVGGTHYISGPSGKKYLDTHPFKTRGIGVSYFSFAHPTYPQYHSRFDDKFLPNMTALDALFNVGRIPLPAKPATYEYALKIK